MAEACSTHGKGQNLLQISSPKPAGKNPFEDSGAMGE